MSIKTENLRDLLENEYPVDIIGIYIDRSGVRIQYRERLGDANIDRQLRKSQLSDVADEFMKKAAYMDASLDRDSKMMMQLESGDVAITIQRVANPITSPDEYRMRQDIMRDGGEQFIFSSKFYPIDNKDAADMTAQTLQTYVCGDEETKYVLELQHLDSATHYNSFARFHTQESFTNIIAKLTSC